MFLFVYVDALGACRHCHGVVVEIHYSEVSSVEGESHQMRNSPADVEKMAYVQEREGPRVPKFVTSHK